MSSQVLLVVLLCIAGSQGFFRRFGGYGGPGSGSGSSRGVCGLPSKPCRLQVTMRHFNGSFVNQMETESCTCTGAYPCPTDWSRTDHVISRNLVSNTYNMTLNMMFCSPITPTRECNLGEEALVVSGSLSIPQNINSYNCRCSDGVPLLLHQRRIGSDHLTYNTYVCDYHKATCPRLISHCLVSRSDVTDYVCKCPSGQFCRLDRNVYGNGDLIYGTCRP